MASVFEASFREFVARRDDAARQKLAPYWERLKAQHPDWHFCSARQTVADSASFFKNLEDKQTTDSFFDSSVTRDVFPQEYILGTGSPFFIQRSKQLPDGVAGQEAVNLVYLHECVRVLCVRTRINVLHR